MKARRPSPPTTPRVRMYRPGFGDCFLVSLPGSSSTPWHLLLDCGVHVGTPNEVDLMKRVARDLAATTGGRLDVVVASHDHWDHLSGFLQARSVFDQISSSIGLRPDRDRRSLAELGRGPGRRRGRGPPEPARARLTWASGAGQPPEQPQLGSERAGRRSGSGAAQLLRTGVRRRRERGARRFAGPSEPASRPVPAAWRLGGAADRFGRVARLSPRPVPRAVPRWLGVRRRGAVRRLGRASSRGCRVGRPCRRLRRALSPRPR